MPSNLDGPLLLERMHATLVSRLADETGLSAPHPLERDPTLLFWAAGMEADAWQRRVLNSTAR